MSVLAIVGGSGFTSLPGLEVEQAQDMATPFGATSAAVMHGRLDGAPLLFLARHGDGHRIPPHCINYRANLWALRAAGADAVVGLAAVGGITPAFGPQVLAVPDQLIDYTYGREATYFDGVARPGAPAGVVHVDMTQPYCAALREQLIAACGELGEPLQARGTYGVTQGPRLETPAEIHRLERDGCDLVGMTGMPEAALARELDLCYASLAFVVNWAAGKGAVAITMTEIEHNLSQCAARIGRVLAAVASRSVGH